MTCLQRKTKEFGYICDYGLKLLKLHFMKILIKFNMKNSVRSIRIYSQCTGQSKIGQIRSFLHGFGPKFSEYFELKFTNDFKYFSNVRRIF